MKTPLYDHHVALGARMAPFGDWDMPIQYSGIIEEHLHTRRAAGLFDICHMGEFNVKGPGASADLDKLITANLASLKVGQCRYGFMLNEQGGVLDDLITYRLAESEFMLVVNSGTTESDGEWIRSHLSADTEFEDMSARTAKLDLQGPMARDILQPLTPADLSGLKYFRFLKTTVNGHDTLVSRTGYTGELGYELYVAVDNAAELWDVLLSYSLVKPVGLGARDTLRLEAGLPLYGHELSEERTPAGSLFRFVLHMGKEFIGKERVAAELEQGPLEKLVGLKLEGRQSARPGQNVTRDGDVVGEITSGSFAPSLQHAIAFAYVAPARSEIGTELLVETGRKTLPATVCEAPFYKEGTARGR